MARSNSERERIKKIPETFRRYLSFGMLIAFAAIADRLWNGVADAAKPFMWNDPLRWATDILIGLFTVTLMAGVWAYFLEKFTGIRIGSSN